MSDIFVFDLQLKTIPVEINPRIIINPVPITLSKEELMRNVSRTDRSCELVIEVSYIEHQNNGNKNLYCCCNYVYSDVIYKLIYIYICIIYIYICLCFAFK